MNNDHNKLHFGREVRKLRLAAGLSQTDLARAIYSNQSTVSRIESSAEPISSLSLLGRLADVLGFNLDDLAPNLGARAQSATEHFVARCPNPFCVCNQSQWEDGQVFVHFESSVHDIIEYENIKFCSRCGEKLVTGCPDCGMPITDGEAKFCVRCGTEVLDRPTQDELATLRKRLEPQVLDDDDIPF